MNPRKPLLIIFDCDGVLVDSEPITGAVFAQMAREQGLEWSPQKIYETFLGRAMRECVRIIEETIGRKLPESFVDEYRSRRNEALRAQLQPTPGMKEMLQELDVPFCVASNGESSKMELTLNIVGLWDLFAGRLFSVHDVAHPKPAPDLYLHAANVMNVAPADAVVVEDSLLGVQAGVRAGMRVVGYSAATPASKLVDAGVTTTVDDLSRLPEVLRSI